MIREVLKQKDKIAPCFCNKRFSSFFHQVVKGGRWALSFAMVPFDFSCGCFVQILLQSQSVEKTVDGAQLYVSRVIVSSQFFQASVSEKGVTTELADEAVHLSKGEKSRKQIPQAHLKTFFV